MGIISISRALGYPVNDSGHCHGIAFMALRAFYLDYLKSQSSHTHFDEFKTRMQIINAVKPGEENIFIKEIKAAETKLKRLEEKETLTDREEILLTMRAFLEGVLLYQMPQEFLEFFPEDSKPRLQTTYHPVSQLIGPDLPPDCPPYAFIIADEEKLQKDSALKTLLTALENIYEEKPLGLIICSSSHTIFLHRTPTGRWYLTNHDLLTAFDTLDTLLPSLIQAVSPHAPVVLTCQLMIAPPEATFRTHIDKAMTSLASGLIIETAPFTQVTLRHHVDINSQKYLLGESLIIAAQHNHVKVVKLLFENHANLNWSTKDNETPLFIAASRNYIEVVKFLLEHHANLNLLTKNGVTPLFIAASKNHVEVVELLLRVGRANPNQSKKGGGTPLYIAVQNNHVEVLALLLQYGAEPNRALEDGTTPLCLAVQKGHREVIKILLLASKESLNQGMQASRQVLLSVAKNTGKEQALIKLLNNNPIQKNFTPLHSAVFFGYKDIVAYLLEQGADVLALCEHISVLQYAKVMGRDEIGHCLIEHILKVVRKKLTDALKNKFQQVPHNQKQALNRILKEISNEAIPDEKMIPANGLSIERLTAEFDLLAATLCKIESVLSPNPQRYGFFSRTLGAAPKEYNIFYQAVGEEARKLFKCLDPFIKTAVPTREEMLYAPFSTDSISFHS